MSSHRSNRPPIWDIGGTGVRALAAFAVVVAAIAAILAWHGRARVQPVAPALPLVTPAASTASAATLVVAVSGRVRHPGLVRLPPGARVADALDAAGGVLPGTDLSSLNLARRLTDGELIPVGVVGVPAPGTGAGGAGGPVNLNTATVEQLQTLPGVGPVLAQRIVDYRDQHGGFTSVEDLRHVSGIGDARFSDLRGRVTV